MSTFEEPLSRLADFSGTARLFPLPNLVMFPHVLQPLHIFEARYRELLEDSLASDRLIAMAMLAPGWERDYEGRPPLLPMACLGRISTHCRVKGGSYNVLLLGVKRVKLVRELAPRKGFREAHVELCDDYYPENQEQVRTSLQEELQRALIRVLPLLPEAREQIGQLLAADVPLAMLSDMISYMLDIDLAAKQALLSELNVCRRAELLLSHLDQAVTALLPATDTPLEFPPGFSAN
jgi:Lon protease-like protein